VRAQEQKFFGSFFKKRTFFLSLNMTTRIIAGTWRGKTLSAPPGLATRPTSQRMRQAVFDMLMHAPWGGRALLEGACVLDGFAGTGAMGLEALSRGAARATFIESDRAALAVLRANLAACGALGRSLVLPADVLRPPRGTAQALVFLDPPYGNDLLPAAETALRQAGWISRGTVVVSESGHLDPARNYGDILAERLHGAARVIVWREA
jgi:16S rRNA (guanine966-N2)-methyltransferase